MKKTATTRLGRAVRESVKADKRTRGQVLDHHSTTNSLRDVILGGQDGLVNMLGIALGVVAAGGSTHVLVVIGVVIGLAGAFGVSRVLSQILYGIKATDPMTYILMSFVIEAGVARILDSEISSPHRKADEVVTELSSCPDASLQPDHYESGGGSSLESVNSVPPNTG